MTVTWRALYRGLALLVGLAQQSWEPAHGRFPFVEYPLERYDNLILEGL
jgi:hypothetical protein